MPSDVTADDDLDAEEIEQDEEEAPKKKLSGKKIVLFAAPVLLLVIVAALYFLGVFNPLLGGGETDPDMAEEEVVPAPLGYFHDLPNLVVNLRHEGRRPNFLKLSISLELADESDAHRIEQIMPRIIDNFQVYLRELNVEDLRGSQGLHRLREELLRRVTVAARPVEVRDILFREMLIQ